MAAADETDATDAQLNFEYCSVCFALRHVASGRFISRDDTAAASEVAGVSSRPITLSADPFFMWRYRGGTFGDPGRLQEAYIMSHLVQESARATSDTYEE